MNKIIYTSFAVFTVVSMSAQGVGINTTGANPDANTILDVTSEGTNSTFFGLKVKNSAGTDQMVVRSDGRVGIMTDAPSYELDVNGNIGGNEFIYHNGDANTYIRLTTDRIRFNAGNLDMLDLVEAGTDEVVINNSSGNIDFRVESNNVASMLFVDAGTDRVSVGSSNTDAGNDAEFNVTGNSSFSDDIRLMDGNVNTGDELVHIYDSGDDGVIEVNENDAMNHRIHGNGTTVFNEQGMSLDFRIEGNTDTHLFFLDGSADRIGISNTTPDGVLSAEGSFAAGASDDGVITAANANASGIGINAAGEGETLNGYPTGSGGAFNGDETALTAFYTTAGLGEAIGAQDGFGATWQVGAWTGGGYRKIIGTGTVSTIVEDLDGNRVVMNCPEAPENLFMDYGQGELVNGYAKILIDPILTKNIIVNEEHPLKVFVQLEGDCNGVYVTNKSAEGFEVIELANGNSNVSFSYSIVATHGDQTYTSIDGHTRVAKYDKRWEIAPPKKETIVPLVPNFHEDEKE